MQAGSPNKNNSDNLVSCPNIKRKLAGLGVHRLMVGDKIKIEKFTQAIAGQIRKDDIVLDIGTGSGVMAFLACEAGAGKVYAVEEHEEILATARREAKRRGLQDSIVFLSGNSKFLPTENIPEKVDVVLSETIGVFGIDEGLLSNLGDAKRFAKAGGAFIPRSLSCFLIPFQLPEAAVSKIFTCPAPVLSGRLSGGGLGPLFPSHPRKLFTVNSSSRDIKRISSTIRFEITSSAQIVGLCGWFEAELAEGVILTNSPYAPKTHWSNMIFKLKPPLWVKKGEALTLDFDALLEEKYIIILMKLKGRHTEELARLSCVYQIS